MPKNKVDLVCALSRVVQWPQDLMPCVHEYGGSLVSQIQPTPAQVTYTITHGEGSGDTLKIFMCYAKI